MKKRIMKSVATTLLLTVALTACGGNSGGEATTAATEASTATEEVSTAAETASTAEEEAPAEETRQMGIIPGTELDKYPAFYAGAMSANPGEIGGGDVSHTVYGGEAGKDYTDEKVYTFNNYMVSTTTLNWSPVAWETHEDTYILDYVSSPFYSFVFTPELDGWSIVPELAAELPEDVTAEYAGQFGIEEGEVGKAWKIALNPDAAWQDGTPIDADSHIYSYQQLLDPKQLNRRADSYYAGEFQVVGAKEYFYQGQTAFEALGVDIADYLAEGGDESELVVDAVTFWNAAGYVDAEGNEIPTTGISISDETIYSMDGTDAEDQDPFSGKQLYEEYLKEGAAYQSESATALGKTIGYEADYSWDNVGILKTGDHELTFILTSTMENPNYYVPYNLSSTYLVYEPLYEKLKTFTNGAFSSRYGTDVEYTMSYGPYKLDYFEADKQITLVRNEEWHGYKDDKHTGQYQADIYNLQILAEHATQLLAFESGELDTVSLQQADMEKYGSSQYIRYEPQSYTTKLTFDTDPETLAERGTEVLLNRNFRQAFSLAIDRTTFAQSYTAAGSPGYGILNYMYVYDPFTGASYRNSEPAMEALTAVYGLTYGEDGDYDDVEEAYDAITGYDIDKARELMQLAYDETTADGTYDGESNVEIQLSVYQSDDIYVQMFNYLNDALQSACEGTGFEGKVSLKMQVDADYYETMYAGGTDMIFSTWGGAAYQPFTMFINVYCDAALKDDCNQMEYGFETEKVMMTVTVNDKDYTDSLFHWAQYLGGEAEITSEDGSEKLDAFGNYDAETRCAFLSKLEYVYLANYVTTPMYYRNVGFLISQKINYPVNEFIDVVGYGGLQFMTFNYDDEEWAKQVAAGLTY